MAKGLKRILSFILAIALVISGISYSPKTVKAADYSGLTYKETNTASSYSIACVTYSTDATVNYMNDEGNALFAATIATSGFLPDYKSVTVNGVTDGAPGAGAWFRVNKSDLTYTYNVITVSDMYEMKTVFIIKNADVAGETVGPEDVPEAATTTTEPPAGFQEGVELFKNTAFNDATSWTLNGSTNPKYNGDGTFSASVNAFNGGNAYDAQLTQVGIPLFADKYYKLTFIVTSDIQKSFRVFVQEYQGGWAMYNQKDVVVPANTPTVVETIFKMTTAEDNATAGIMMAALDGGSVGAANVTFSNVSLKGYNTEPAPTVLSGIAVSPVKDAFIYNFTDVGGGHKIVFEDGNNYPDYTVTYTATVNGTSIGNVTSGQTVDLSALGLTAGQKYPVTVTARYTNGDASGEATSAQSYFVYGNTVPSPYNTGLAKVYVTTSKDASDNSIDIYTDSTKEKFNAALMIVDTNGTVYSDFGTINVRGNSTAMAQKKPFNIKFDNKYDVFGMGSAKKWSLLANLFDKTMLRNQIALDFIRGLEEGGNQYTSKAAPVDVYVDGKYLGTYTLVESVEAGKTRVDIDVDYVDDNGDFANGATHSSVTINGKTYTLNDALLELANDCKTVPSRMDPETFYFSTNMLGEWFSINEPAREEDSTYNYSPDTASPQFVTNLKTFIDDFEVVINDTSNAKYTEAQQFDLIEQFIDVDSFVDFYITAELFMGKDIDWSSTRFYVKGGKLYAGPLWDFDLSAGNLIDHKGYEGFYAQMLSWFELLMANEEFYNEVVDRYNELQPTITALYADNGTIDTAQAKISESVKYNYENAYNPYSSADNGYKNGWGYQTIYGLTGAWTGDAAAGLTAANEVYGSNNVYPTYDEYVEEYKDWVEGRNAWLLAQFGEGNGGEGEGTDEPIGPGTVEPVENGPDGAVWTEVPNTNTEFQYFIPAESTNYVAANGEGVPTILKESVGSDNIYMAFMNVAAITGVTINGTTVEPSNAGLYRMSTPGLGVGYYELDFTDANGTTFTVWIKKNKVTDYNPTGLAVNFAEDSTATVVWTPSQDAIDAGYTYDVTITKDNDSSFAAVTQTGITGGTATLSGIEKHGNYTVTLQTKDGSGNVINTHTLSAKKTNTNWIDCTVEVKHLWEAKRTVRLYWSEVPEATGYAIYADGKLIDTVETNGTVANPYYIHAYEYANATNSLGQPTTVGNHNFTLVALFNGEEAVDYASVPATSVMTEQEFRLYVNYVYGNDTDIWNKTGVDSVWNFTICEDAEAGDIERGAIMGVNYDTDGASILTYIDRGLHSTYVGVGAEGDQEWTIKAAIYDQDIVVGELLNLSFDIKGPAYLVGQQINIKCVPEECDENDVYFEVGDRYEEKLYTFESATDANGEEYAVLHYTNSFTSVNETYDLLFGLGLLEIPEDATDRDLSFSDTTVTKIYGVTSVTATGIYNNQNPANNSGYISWTTDVPEHLSNEYTYTLVVKNPDGTVLFTKENATNNDIYEGFALDTTYTVEVSSIYNETVTATKSTTMTITATSAPDLVISDISIPEGEYRVGQQVPISVTIKNIGTQDATATGLTAALNFTDANGAVIGTITVPGGSLAVGATYTGTINYTVKAEDVGTQVLFATADNGSVVTESNEANNTYSEKYRFYPAKEVVTLTNDGQDVVATWPALDGATEYIVEYTTSDGTVKTTTVTEPTLTFPEGDALENGSTVTVKLPLDDGSKYVYAEGVAKADLIITTITPDGVAVVGQNKDIVVTVKNVGTAAAEDDIKVAFSTTFNGTGTTSTDLAPNATTTITVSGFNSNTAGTVALNATVDPENVIVEGKDDNNDGTGAVVVVGKGTLDVSEDGTATWTDDNVTAPNPLTNTGYKLTYTTGGVEKTVDVPAGQTTYTITDPIDDGTTVKVSGAYSQAGDTYYELAEDTYVAPAIPGEWRLITGDSVMDVPFDASTVVVGTIYFYDSVGVTMTNDVVGYNDYFMALTGDASYYTGTATLSVSEASQTVLYAEDAAGLTFTNKNVQSNTAGEIQIDVANVFEVKYTTNYYLLKIDAGSNITYVPVKIEVETGDVGIKAFQMNTNNAEGGIAEFNPSFRVVTETAKVMTVDGVLYKVKSHGTLYALDESVNSNYSSMVMNSSNPAVKYFESTNVGVLANWASADEHKYNIYYALSFKYEYYSYDSLVQKMAFRPYVVLDDGKNTVVYGESTYATSIEEIAEHLYTNKLMGTKSSHDFLYNNVLNIVALNNNRDSIIKSIMTATGVTSTGSPNYALVRKAYNDMADYVKCNKGYTYADHNDGFKCSTDENEATLISLLNTSSGTSYASVAEWIEGQVATNGFYAKVEFQSGNDVNNGGQD